MEHHTLRFASVIVKCPENKTISFHVNLDGNHSILLEQIIKPYKFACDCIGIEKENRCGHLCVDIIQHSAYAARSYRLIQVESLDDIKINTYDFKSEIIE